jgi:hypothetical protein
VTFEPGSRMTYFDDSAFKSCSSLQAICIPASARVISDGCFSHCNRLSLVTFASGSQLQQIRDCAFGNCSSLRSICIPSSTQIISNFAFDSCNRLSTIILEPGHHLTSRSLAALHSLCPVTLK